MREPFPRDYHIWRSINGMFVVTNMRDAIVNNVVTAVINSTCAMIDEDDVSTSGVVASTNIGPTDWSTFSLQGFEGHEGQED